MSATTIEEATTVDVATAQAELDRLLGTRDAAAAAHDSAQARLVEVNARLAGLDELEGEVALGERDATEHEQTRRSASEAAAAAQDEIRRTGAVQAALEPRVADAERELAVAHVGEASATLDRLGEKLVRVGERFRDTLAEAVKLARARDRLLAQAAEEVARAAQLAKVAGVAAPLAPDEADWRPDGLEVLVDSIAAAEVQGQPFVNLRAVVKPASPLTPRADAERRAQAFEASRPDEVVDDDLVAVTTSAQAIVAAGWRPECGWPVDPSSSPVDVGFLLPRLDRALEGLPEDLHSDAFAMAAELLEQRRRLLGAHVEKTNERIEASNAKLLGRETFDQFPTMERAGRPGSKRSDDRP